MKIFAEQLGLYIGHRVNSVFLVYSKTFRRKKNGDPFLQLVLSDRTGQVDAVVWNNVEVANEAFEDGHLIEIDGPAEVFRSKPQINIQRFRVRPVTEVDSADFSPDTTGAPDEFAIKRNGFSQMNNWVVTDDNIGIAQRSERAMEMLKERLKIGTAQPVVQPKPDPKPHLSSEEIRHKLAESASRVAALREKYKIGRPNKQGDDNF